MHFKSFLLQILSLITLISTSARGHPSDVSVIEKGVRVPCDPIEKYTVDWFVCHTCKRPKTTTCLFYTKGLSKKAQKFAKADGKDMTTIWEMWPEHLYHKNVRKDNPLRCIMTDPNKRAKYFAHMSIAMAVQCHDHATVLDPTPDDVEMQGIFGKKELPTLKSNENILKHPIHGGLVNKVEAVKPDGSDAQVLWKRNSDSKRDVVDPMPEDFADLCERGLQNPICGHTKDKCGISDDDTAAAFDVGGEFPVEW